MSKWIRTELIPTYILGCILLEQVVRELHSRSTEYLKLFLLKFLLFYRSSCVNGLKVHAKFFCGQWESALEAWCFLESQKIDDKNGQRGFWITFREQVHHEACRCCDRFHFAWLHCCCCVAQGSDLNLLSHKNLKFWKFFEKHIQRKGKKSEETVRKLKLYD